MNPHKSTYKEAGVDIEEGDACSGLAYRAAKATFVSRAGQDMIGSPIVLEGGFKGLIDMGDFYLVQNDDGVGSKMMVADALRKYDTIGRDLLAMVADDAICAGAEAFSVSSWPDRQFFLYYAGRNGWRPGFFQFRHAFSPLYPLRQTGL